jgi:hypothetical protein
MMRHGLPASPERGRSESDIIREALRIYKEACTSVPESVLEGSFSVPGLSGRAIAEEDEPLKGFGEDSPP